MKRNHPHIGLQRARLAPFLDAPAPLRVVGIGILLLASGMAGCLGEGGASPSLPAPGPEGWQQTSHYDIITGGLAATFDGAAAGSVGMYAANVTFPFAPFAIQAYWMPLGDHIESLMYGYELEFRHQLEGEMVSAGAGDVRAGTPPLNETPAELAGATVIIEQNGPGHLILAWAELPEGLHVQFDLDASPTEIRRLDVEFHEITEAGSGAFVFTPVARLAGSERVADATDGLDMVFLKYMVPSNAGAGTLRVSAHHLEWQDELRQSSSPCPDCFERRAYLGVVDGPWSMELTYAGRSGNFQGFVTVIHLQDLEADVTSTFYPAAPCADLFACH